MINAHSLSHAEAWRRRAGIAAFVSLAVLSLSPLGCSREPHTVESETAERKPVQNVVLICLDTVRFDSFWTPEASGSPDALSPWAQRAIRFERANATAPWTLPSVASVFTGLYPRRHGVGAFADPIANLDVQIPSPVPADLPVISELASRSGVATAAFVAHPWFGDDFRLGKGFDRLDVRGDEEALVARAKDWLSRQSDERPLFLYLHFMQAHEMHRQKPPLVREAADAVRGALREHAIESAPGGACDDPASARCRRYLAYVHAISRLRDTVADLLAHLDSTAWLESSVVILYSDHGEEFRDHGAEQKAWRLDPRGFYGAGHGQSLFQEQLHVPLLVWHPDHDGRSIQRPVSLIDLFPTFVGVLGLSPPEPPPRVGVDLLEQAEQPDRRLRPRLLLASGIAYGPEQVAVISWPWKRVAWSGLDQSLLYDLKSDPAEKRPLGRRNRHVESMDRALRRYLELQPFLQGEAPDLREEDLERLRALGYLGGRKAGDA